MSRVLLLELPDEVYQPIAQAAAQRGQTPEEWAVERLRASAPSAAELATALARLMRHAGAVDLGRATGADNPAIDADLAREYGTSHEGAP
jgi:hypothetical protein